MSYYERLVDEIVYEMDEYGRLDNQLLCEIINIYRYDDFKSFEKTADLNGITVSIDKYVPKVNYIIEIILLLMLIYFIREYAVIIAIFFAINNTFLNKTYNVIIEKKV